MKAILNPQYGLYEKDGQPFCDSLQIAETFGKQHAHVLRDIGNRLRDISDSGQSKFGESNFIKTSYRNIQGKRQPKYLLTRDGFTFLVTSYSGKKATAFKIAYIKRFNEMEQFIKSLYTAKIEFPAFTSAIMEAHEEPKPYHFSNEINMIYRIVLGMDAKKFREMHGLEKNTVIRPYLTAEQIQIIEDLQRMDIGLLISVQDFQDRKQILENQCAKMLQRKFIAA